MDEFYQSTVCHVCKTFTLTLKRCSQCKLYVYCSRQHQKLHWKNHKQFCNMVYALLIGKKRQHILDIPIDKDLTSVGWNQMKVSLKLLWEHLLKRKLTPGENQVWMFPRVCEICHYAKQEILFDCLLCYSVSYCCPEHRQSHFNNHDKFCQSLKLCYEINTFLFNNKSCVKLIPKIAHDVETLPENTDIFIKNCVTLQQYHSFVDIFAAEFISPFLTMIFALQTCNLLPNRQYCKNSLVIHLIGASNYELKFSLVTICEFFFNWIKNLTKLTLILIGPELPYGNKITKQLRHDRSYSLIFERCCYHDYVHSETMITADLITALNCGLHEHAEKGSGDDWAQSIPFLTVGTTPLLLTSYTFEEAQRDLHRLNCPNTDVIVECIENKYKGSRPLRNWESPETPIFYQNNYVTVVRPH